jgi:hypothetical protein
VRLRSIRDSHLKMQTGERENGRRNSTWRYEGNEETSYYRVGAVAPRCARCGSREAGQHKPRAVGTGGLCFRPLDYHDAGQRPARDRSTPVTTQACRVVASSWPSCCESYSPVLSFCCLILPTILSPIPSARGDGSRARRTAR